MKTVFVGLALALVASMTSGVVSRLAAAAPQVSQKAADAWPGKWCQAQPGNTREEIIAIMGPPTGSSATTMMWSAHQYQFNAFLDAGGKVQQLDINTHSLSPAEQAALKCEPIRTRATVARAASKAASKPPHKLPAPCGLVSEAEMSAILGVPVVATPRPGNNTECTYHPAGGGILAVKLSVDWGDGAIAMSSAGMMGRREPGLTSPYEGLGDQAVAVGPALMIRTGDDLMTIVFTGITGAPAKAKRIFDTAKPRM